MNPLVELFAIEDDVVAAMWKNPTCHGGRASYVHIVAGHHPDSYASVLTSFNRVRHFRSHWVFDANDAYSTTVSILTM